LSELPETTGYTAVPFTDPHAALAWAQRPDAHFDAPITDQTMPDMIGLERAPALRRERPTLPEILCTGLADGVKSGDLSGQDIGVLFPEPVPLQDPLDALTRLLRAPA
jgi:CheY-like chemotaxis protein